MAEVFAAQSPSGAPAAVKVLHAAVAGDSELLARFWREVQIAGEIAHPNVVRVLDHGLVDDGRPYLAMERLEGCTLAELASRSGGVGLEELLGYMDQLLDVLGAAHDRGVVHRDLKPANLFVVQDGQLKVLDFGIARLMERGADDLRTATGMALGTVSYMSPEQASGQRDEIDGRTDLFAVGAILFRLLSGRRVHEGRNQGEMLLKAGSRPAPPLGSVAPQVPSAVAAVVDRALAFDKRDRFADARSMRRALAEARSGFAAPSPALPAADDASAAPADVTVLSAGSAARTPVQQTLLVTAAAGLPAHVPPHGLPVAAAPTRPDIARSMRRSLLAVGALAVLGSGVIVSTILVALWFQRADDADKVVREQVDSSTLLAAYRADPVRAKETYGSAVVRTTSAVREAQSGSPGALLLGGPTEPWLQCEIFPVPTLPDGTVITVRGTISGFVDNPQRVLISGCEIVQ